MQTYVYIHVRKRIKPNNTFLESQLLRRLRQEDTDHAYLGYRVSSRPTWVK